MKFEVNDLKAIGEALEGIIEKFQEQFAPVAFDVTLEYPGFQTGEALLVRMTSLPDEPWRYLVDITEKPVDTPPEHERFAVEEHGGTS